MHSGGTILPLNLTAGERLKVDTGCLVALDSTVDYDIVRVGGIKTSLFGGEGALLRVADRSRVASGSRPCRSPDSRTGSTPPTAATART